MKLLLVSLLSLAAYQASAYTLYNTQPYYAAKPVSRGVQAQAQQCEPLPSPVLLLAERACGSPGALSDMPLQVVAQDSLHVVRDGQAQVRVSALSPQRPFATVAGPALPQPSEALRAVRVELSRPVLLSSLRSTLPFPDSFVVVLGADGAAAPLAIRTVLAPVPAGTVLSPSHPVAVSVLYALPLDPFSAALAQPHHRQPLYNYYGHGGYYADAPLYQHTPADYFAGYGFEDQQQQLLLPQQQPQFQVHFQHRPQYQVQHTQPQQAVQADGSKKPGANIVTILDFPSAVASPESLFFQPEDPDSELGNRQPPQAVSPAGIVQSTQPQPNLSVFVNSKESAILQGLRDEAEKEQAVRNRLAIQAGLRGLPSSLPGVLPNVDPALQSIVVDAAPSLRESRSSAEPKKTDPASSSSSSSSSTTSRSA